MIGDWVLKLVLLYQILGGILAYWLIMSLNEYLYETLPSLCFEIL